LAAQAGHRGFCPRLFGFIISGTTRDAKIMETSIAQ
jgi:hypothetical protein